MRGDRRFLKLWQSGRDKPVSLRHVADLSLIRPRTDDSRQRLATAVRVARIDVIDVRQFRLHRAQRADLLTLNELLEDSDLIDQALAQHFVVRVVRRSIELAPIQDEEIVLHLHELMSVLRQEPQARHRKRRHCEAEPGRSCLELLANGRERRLLFDHRVALPILVPQHAKASRVESDKWLELDRAGDFDNRGLRVLWEESRFLRQRCNRTAGHSGQVDQWLLSASRAAPSRAGLIRELAAALSFTTARARMRFPAICL